MERKVPVITCARHRIQCDGQGITTLVLLHGCPLRCRWCLNSYSYQPDTPTTALTPRELYEKVKIDELYFLATGGGVTFGGGEPLLHPDFIAAFRKECSQAWHICVESSLAVPWENVEKVASAVDMFYIDCKDANPEIYRRYTGGDNSLMIDNIKRLLALGWADRMMLRLPLIPSYNTPEDREKSRAFFEAMGVVHFDEFTYTVKE